MTTNKTPRHQEKTVLEAGKQKIDRFSLSVCRGVLVSWWCMFSTEIRSLFRIADW